MTLRRLTTFPSSLALTLAGIIITTAAKADSPQLSISGGDYQQLLRTGMPAVAAFQPISVRATGADGNPVQGLAVTFGWHSTNQNMRCYINPDEGVATITATTGPDGVAVLSAMQGRSMVCSQADGQVLVTATAQSLPAAPAHIIVGPLAGSITAMAGVTPPLSDGSGCVIFAFALLNQPSGSAPPYPAPTINMVFTAPNANWTASAVVGPDGVTETLDSYRLLAKGEHVSMTASMAGGPGGDLTSSSGGDCPSQSPRRHHKAAAPAHPSRTKSGK